PVAPFGDQYLLAGLGRDNGIGDARRIECRAGLGQLTPATLILPVPDPDVEVRVDPGPGKNASHLGLRATAGFAHCHGSKLGMAREPAVQSAEEWPPAALEVL